MYFPYDDAEMNYLKQRDKKLGEIIDQLGHLKRNTSADLFCSVVDCIVGQQISSAAHRTVWARITEGLGEVTPDTICALTAHDLQKYGMSMRKAEYIMDFARKVHHGELDIDALYEMDDAEVIRQLSALRGIGVWTAEMLMLFTMQRPDILSYGDLAIQRGIRMIYHHRSVGRELFEKYRRRYSPYGSTASLYIWAVAGGAVEGMRDYALKTAPKKKN